MEITGTRWTPLQIELLIHYHVSRARFPRETDTIDQQRNDLIQEGLLWEATSEHFLTKAGIAFLKHILNTPVPTARWEFSQDGDE